MLFQSVRAPLLVMSVLSLFLPFFARATEPPVSKATKGCLICHTQNTPGIVADWRASRMSRTTPRSALAKPELERRFSAKNVPDGLLDVVVGCAECHQMNAKDHPDTFIHLGQKVHIVVTPRDCGTCHPVEVEQYGHDLMANARGNLHKNPLYHDMASNIIGPLKEKNGKLETKVPGDEAFSTACDQCHGTKLEVLGLREKQTTLGVVAMPHIKGWPNHGVGRVNPDGTKGSCTSCHPRHGFSIAVARKPATCGQCHKGPDVPAHKVYLASKHGNLYKSIGEKNWNFDAVPWTIGKDFTAPTCATCHASQLVNTNGMLVTKRTHHMGSRLPWRLFGLPYAHPFPKSGDTTVIKNKAGLTLPTELTGEPVAKFLISGAEQEKRWDELEKVCLGCHGRTTIAGFREQFDATLKDTNEATLAATRLLQRAWAESLARGPAQKDSIFNEHIERLWVEKWLFYSNSTRLATAMVGADYGVFYGGRWQERRTIGHMVEWLELKRALMGKKPVHVPQKVR